MKTKYVETNDFQASLQRLIPDLFKYKTVLYIGASRFRCNFCDQFQEAEYKITILEACPLNVQYYKELDWIHEVIHNDVRTFHTNKKYDIVFWWHGPEHIEKQLLHTVLCNLEKITNVAIVLGCPWGKYEQGEHNSNPYDVHYSHHNHFIFEDYGYTVECLGIKDVPTKGNIVAVKYNKESLVT